MHSRIDSLSNLVLTTMPNNDKSHLPQPMKSHYGALSKAVESQ